MSIDGDSIPAGWHVDEKSGCLMRDTIHHMGRRCRNWDYADRGCYLITMTLRDRSRPVLGSVRRGMGGEAHFEPTELGRLIEAHVRRLPDFSSEIEILGAQLMPNHLHVVLRARRRMAKPLGDHLRGFKIGCTKIYRAMDGTTQKGAAQDGAARGGMAQSGMAQEDTARGGAEHHSRIDARGQGEAARGHGFFADGFVDTILFNDEALARALAYMADNPRRLLEKREHAEYFRVVRNLAVRSPIDGRDLHFAAIGNQHLLAVPSLVQVQGSRRDFAYSKNSNSRIDARAKPVICTSSFEEKAADLLAAASHGAVLVSPCISHGEKEIARRAMAKGARLVVLLNKGFAPLYKPPGLYFDRCVEGRLLMLAPSAWPYRPGEKAMTRQDACVLNRIAQLLCGAGAAEIDYKGLIPTDLERLVESATKQP